MADVVPNAGGTRRCEGLHLQGCAVAGDGCGNHRTGRVIGLETQVHALVHLDAQGTQVDVVLEVLFADLLDVVGAVHAIVLDHFGGVLLLLQLLDLDAGLFDFLVDGLVDGGLLGLLGFLLLTKSEHGVPPFAAPRVRVVFPPPGESVRIR